MNHKIVLLVLVSAILLFEHVYFCQGIGFDFRQNGKRKLEISQCAERKRHICEAMKDYCYSDETEAKYYQSRKLVDLAKKS
ncbi:hypothetical protein OS493_008507 [Desmophyllum pertusum]|uniref:Uncharacterized protein n=1 Tax=Desmophyllum pertusum TaxID=174260 RepID=A0A9X0D678_9CNID|nr:hypothetical protein OS493_008507 [Desmophyllum pertusum]